MTEAAYPARVGSPGIVSGILRLDLDTGAGAQEPAAGIVAAIVAAAGQLRALQRRADDLGREILRFQLEMLEDDRLVLELLEASDLDGVPCNAVSRIFDGQISAYAASVNERFASRAADLTDIRDRLLSALAGRAAARPQWPDDTILLVEDLTPSGFLELDRSKVVGIVDRRGSTASHAALLARAEGVPMLVAAGAIEPAAAGRPVLLDGERGALVIDPAASRRGERVPAAPAAEGEDDRPAVMPDGETVEIHLTVNALGMLDQAPAGMFDGIGLVRTELLVRDGKALDDARVQAGLYRPLFEWAGERPVTVRLFDAGGDKPLAGLAPAGGGFLGLRGARLLKQRPRLLRTQLAAILRAADGAFARVMVPMVTLPDEMDFFRRELDDAIGAAGADKAKVMLGMMVETPAAAVRISSFDSDFYSLGTNDLAQYTLAASRDGDDLADMPRMPEAVIELVSRVVDHAAAAGRPVTLCGDVAASPEELGRLLGSGVRSFSVPPRLAGPFKRFVRAGR